MTAVTNPGTTRHLDVGPVLLYSNSYTSASSVHLAADHPELLREPGRTAVFAKMCGSGHHAAEAKLARAKTSAVPTLVLMGTADEDFPDAVAESRFVAESLDGRLEMLDGYGHQPHEEAPELIAELILGFDPAGPAKSAE